MKKILFTLFLSILVGFTALAQQPTVKWNASTEEVSEGIYQLVLSGKVADDYYTHPLTDKYNAPSIDFDGYEAVGDPEEDYTPSDYKGETVVTGDYVLKQNFKSENGSVKGTVTWQSCSGDHCYMPEDWEFDIAAEAAQEPAAAEQTLSAPAKEKDGSLLALILEAILWGLAMLLTPCVFPMVPMTVSFFIKGSENKSRGRFNAAMYGLFIVLLYTVPICVIIGLTWVLGGDSVTADIFNWLATHWLPNILFFTIFMVFAASFFGAFEITLPSKWVNSSDKKSDKKGLGGIFFLALTLVLVSFSCTGPIVGTVLIKSTQGEFWTPMVTMLAFSIAFALPFTLLAFFPSLLKNLPKSGGWLNSVKVVLGFVEVALAFKFLSTADQTYHWGLLDREVYLAIWIVTFSLLGFYLLGKIRFANDTPVDHLNVKRLALSILVFSFVVYMIPGMWGAPLKALSGYLPPIETQDFVLGSYVPVIQTAEPDVTGATIEMPHGLVGYDNIEDALVEAEATGKRVFVDITGFGCVNCREMEARVWSDPRVLDILRKNYVMVALYNDDKTKLPESKWITTEEGKVLKDVGRVNSYIARTRFDVNAQPNYALLDASGNLLVPVRGYDLSIDGFIDFLNSAL
ncbi:MAG: cytochrome c biogenesis protein CcdA [Bacteroidia bacterium]|nr:cytochrome c biogenesis protein CcdA [Bacteroidia bacterium]